MRWKDARDDEEDESCFSKKYVFRATVPSLIVVFVALVLFTHYIISPLVWGRPSAPSVSSTVSSLPSNSVFGGASPSDMESHADTARSFEHIDLKEIKQNLHDCQVSQEFNAVCA